MEFVEAKAESEFSGVAVPCRFDVFVGSFPDALLCFCVGKFTGKLQQQCGRVWLFETGDGSGAMDTIYQRRHVPARLSDLASLRCEIPGGSDDANRPANVLVRDRVVVEVELNRIFLIPGHIVRSGVLPPFIERAVMSRAEDLVIEPQTEARATESVGPDLGVLTMTAHLAVVPLLRQV